MIAQNNKIGRRLVNLLASFNKQYKSLSSTWGEDKIDEKKAKCGNHSFTRTYRDFAYSKHKQYEENRRAFRSSVFL